MKWLKVPRSTNRKPTINEEIHERVSQRVVEFFYRSSFDLAVEIDALQQRSRDAYLTVLDQ